MVYAYTGGDSNFISFVFTHTATLVISEEKSLVFPSVPFLVFFPQARAVPAAAESVTPLVPKKVLATVAYGN